MQPVLSELQARVYFALRKFGSMGPTRLGAHLQIQYEAASQTVTRPLKYLVKLGLVERIEVNQRIVHYRCKHETPPPMVILTGGEKDYMKEFMDADGTGQSGPPASL